MNLSDHCDVINGHPEKKKMKQKKLKNTLKLPKFDKDHNLFNKSEQRKITLRHIIVKVLKNKEEKILILASKK